MYVIDVLDTSLAGTENQLIKLINGLDKNRFEIHLLCFRNHPWFEAHGHSLDCAKTVIEINQFKRPSTYWNIVRLIGFFRRERPDVVHTFFPVANIVAVVAAWLSGVKNIISSRRDYGEWMSSSYLFFTRIANRFVRKIIANSHSVKSLTIQAEGVMPEKVEVFYNGIDIENFSDIAVNSELKRKLNISVTNKVIGIVANFRPMKRHDTFLYAAREILKVRNDVDFVLVGGGGAAELDTQTLGRTLGIAERLHYVGLQTDIAPYLSIMDVGVNCSEREGLSNAVMEYMAAGVPCVVSRSGGNADLIAENETGLTFLAGDYRALSAAVLTLLENESPRRRLAQNAKDKVYRQLTVPVMLSNYQDLYRRIAN